MAKGGNIPFQAVNLDVAAYDELIRSQGAIMLHYRAVPCPIGMVDPLDTRAPSHDHSNCSNGYIYKLAGEVTVLFTNNTNTTNLGDYGLLDGSQAFITFPRFYDDQPEKRVVVSNKDRLFYKHLSGFVSHSEKFESSSTGKTRLSFPAITVDYLFDANGKEYYINSDFIIDHQGSLVWINPPPYDATNDRGTVCSVVYQYVPYYYVSRLVHEVRVSQQNDFITNAPTFEREQYSAVVSRENYFRNQDASNENKDNRAGFQPRDGMFTPR